MGDPPQRFDNRQTRSNMAAPKLQTDHKRKLDEQYVLLKRQILQYQSPTLGLFPRMGYSNQQTKVAYVRDSVYCAAASWALAQAYKRIDNDQGHTHELQQIAVKCMRGILYCWINQAEKVEKFKLSQSPDHALHTVFDALTGDPIYRDDEYEHLQIDVIGLFLIFLVQMITSGLQIIFTTDEVNFVQNLVFYVERAYRTPDFGMWERGSKYNNGSTEIHASSIGISKAALETVNGVNLFGDNGASWSVVFVDIDAHNRNRTIFESILPRESNSKNTDASLLPTVSWPAFGIHEEPIRSRTIDKVMRKLAGKCGVKRFIRDGYKTVMEDKNRKYYKPAEIKNFDGIECEWPMFYVHMLIESVFRGDKENITKYSDILDSLLFRTNEGDLLPQYYYVPHDQMEIERQSPGSADRFSSDDGSTRGVFLWGQSIYFISQLLVNDLLNINELDPIRRHLPASERPKVNSRYSSFQVTPPDLVVQVVLIAESPRLQQLLATYGIQTQTPHQIEPIQIWSPKELSKAYEHLGKNRKLGISGRPKRPFGVLSTSKIYRICGSTVVCYPLLFEVTDFYMAQDISIVIDDLKNDLAFLSQCWKLSGRPTFCMLIRENNIKGKKFTEFLDLLAQVKGGDIDGVRVRVGRLQSLISSACLEHLDFLGTLPDPSIFIPFEEASHGRNSFKSLTDIPALTDISDTSVLDEHDLTVKSTWDLIQIYRCTESLKAKSQILKQVFTREGPNYNIDGTPVSQQLERLVTQASIYKEWEVVRLSSALLGKLVDSLAPSITSILVRGKHVLKQVFTREGPNYNIDGTPVSQQLERLVTQASIYKEWEVVRLSSALLGKLVDSLAPSITSILVRGKHVTVGVFGKEEEVLDKPVTVGVFGKEEEVLDKPVTVGVFGKEEEVLDKPVSPNEIKHVLYSRCSPYDLIQAVLQQELILAIGKHIATSPECYDGILKIRIGWFVRAMEMELEQEDGGVKLTTLSPYEIKMLLRTILEHKHAEDDYRTPLQQRQLDGALSRVPKDFYGRVWEILERSPAGIKVAGYLLPQQPTLSDMTMQELNFSLLVEQMLSKIIDPAYRQLVVETFMVVSTILRRNPELIFHQAVHMDRTIQDAFDDFQKDRSRLEGHEKQDDMKCFFNTQPNIKHGTTSYIVKAVVKNLLDGDIKVATEDLCCIS